MTITNPHEIITATTIRQDDQNLMVDSLQMGFSTVSDSIIQMDILALPESRPIYYHRLRLPEIVKPQPIIPEHIQVKVIDDHYFLVTLGHNGLTTLRPITAIKANSLEFWDLPKREVRSLGF